MKIAVGSDHAGYRLKGEVAALIQELDTRYLTLGPTAKSLWTTLISQLRLHAVTGGELTLASWCAAQDLVWLLPPTKSRDQGCHLRDTFSARAPGNTTTPTCCALAPGSPGAGLPLKSSRLGRNQNSRVGATQGASKRLLILNQAVNRNSLRRQPKRQPKTQAKTCKTL